MQIEIKCSDPRIKPEFGRGKVLLLTLQDEGKEAAEELLKAYAGGYLHIKVTQ